MATKLAIWSRPANGGWSLELGGEAVLNRLDSAVDLYSIEAETVTANFEELGASDRVAPNPALATFITYHFLTSKSNPRGRVYIAMLNRGITEMRESGEWYDIVATGLAEYNKLSQ